MFDISEFDLATASDEGRPMQVLKPNGEPFKDSDGNNVTITLFGRLSLQAKQAERRLAELRLEKSKIGTKRNLDDVEREEIEMLVSLTKGWSFDSLDGQSFPYSEANARLLWSDRRFSSVREQATRFVQNDANFMKG